MKDMTNNKRS